VGLGQKVTNLFFNSVDFLGQVNFMGFKNISKTSLKTTKIGVGLLSFSAK